MSESWFASRKAEVASGAFGLLGGLTVEAYNTRAKKRIREALLTELASSNGHIPRDRMQMTIDGLRFVVTPLESADSPTPTKYHVAVTNTAIPVDTHNRTAEFSYDQRTRKVVLTELIK